VGAGTGRSGNSLHFDFDIAANSWGTCAAFFETPQTWTANDMLVFYFHTLPSGTSFDVDLYTGSADNRATYVMSIETPAESSSDWSMVGISLDAFQRASWEENAGAALTPSDKIAGLAIGVAAPESASNTGELWVDDLKFSPAQPAAENEQPEVDSTTAPDTQSGDSGEEQPAGRPSLPCTGGVVLPLIFLGLVRFNGRKR
jgi:hypothetical protein